MLLKTNGIPLYIQIHSQLKARIHNGTYSPDTLLPSENVLIKEFDVTRSTLRQAIKLLQLDGLVITEKGKGSRINAAKREQSLFKFYSFGRNFTRDLHNTSTTVIDADTLIPDEAILDFFKPYAPKSVHRICRVRWMEEIPVIVEISYVPSQLAPNLLSEDLSQHSIYDLLEQKYRNPILRAREHLDAVNCPDYFSALLHTDPSQAVFLVERLTYTTGEQPLEYRVSYIRGDKFRFFVDL